MNKHHRDATVDIWAMSGEGGESKQKQKLPSGRALTRHHQSVFPITNGLYILYSEVVGLFTAAATVTNFV